MPLLAQLLRLARDLRPVELDQGRLVGRQAMTATHPPKELVRAYLAKRTHEESPPPSPQEVREQLGWKLLREEQFPEVQR